MSSTMPCLGSPLSFNREQSRCTDCPLLKECEAKVREQLDLLASFDHTGKNADVMMSDTFSVDYAALKSPESLSITGKRVVNSLGKRGIDVRRLVDQGRDPFDQRPRYMSVTLEAIRNGCDSRDSIKRYLAEKLPSTDQTLRNRVSTAISVFSYYGLVESQGPNIAFGGSSCQQQ